MEKFRVKQNALAYNLKGKGLKNHKISPSNGIFMQGGRIFDGKLVFLRMPYGFQPMIKVLDNKLKDNYYYFLNDVTPLGKQSESSFNGDFMSAEMYPNLLHYSYASPYNYSPLMDYKDGYPQYHSADGNSEVNNVKELTPNQVKNIFNNSNTKLKFEEWLNSPEGKDSVNNIASLALSLLVKDDDKKNVVEEKVKEDDKKADVKILGMHPLTFAAVSIVVIVGGIIAFSVIKNKNKQL